MTISQTLLPEYDEEMANTRKLLELVPEDQFSYKPHERSMTLGQLASHVADMTTWTKGTIEEDRFDMPAGMEPFLAKSRQELLSAFDKGAAEGREQLAGVSDEHLGKTWTMTYGGETIVSMPRTGVLRKWVLNHLIHHRAQLGVYLRLLNIAIPGMYGPSADEMQSMSAQSA